MRLGLGRFGLSPRVFWALSLKEWRALVEERLGGQAPTLARGEFEALMKVYPDGE